MPLVPLRRWPLLGAALLAACAGRAAGPQGPTDPAAIPPVLPAAVGQVYGRGAATPGDPVVAALLGSWSWDEALSGAAGSLALEHTQGFDLQTAQWAAWRAGYPWPVVLGATGPGAGLAPPAPVAELLAGGPPAGADLGLARARLGEQDRWVALLGQPFAALPPFPRQLAEGEVLVLPLPEGTPWVLVDPEGSGRSGTGPVEQALGAWGEWWVEAELPGGRLSLPLYVGMEMPPAPVVDLPGAAAVGPDDARAQAWAVLADIRDTFDVAALQPDPLLETLGRLPLDEALAGTWTHEENLQRLRAAGFAGAAVDQVPCRAATVAACLEGALRTAAGRQALLDPELRVAGVTAAVGSGGVVLVVSLAGA